MRKSFTKALSLFMAAAMTVSLASGIAAPQTADAATLPTDKVASFMTAPYHAYLCFQTDRYSYRDPFDNDTTGITNTSVPKTTTTNIYESEEKMALDGATTKTANAGVSVFDWKKMYIQMLPATGTAKTEEIDFRDLNADGTLDKYTVPKPMKAVVKIADFMQPDVTYDGTYTVSMSNFAETAFQYDHGFRMLFVDTTIPLSKTGVSFSNVSLKIDGVEVSKTEKGVLRNSNDCPNSYQLMVVNEYGYDNYGLKAQAENSKGDAVPDPIWEAAKTNGGVINMPKKSIEITFTVSGLGAAPAGYVPQDDHAIAASTAAIVAGQQQQQQAAAASRAALSSLAKGKTFTVGNLTYKVTKAAETNGKANVAVTGVAKKAQKKTSLSVPKTATYKDYDYKITAVNGKAFSKCKKLKSVTLGANVTTLEKNAFANCKKLSTLTVKGKLKTVKKKAFKGCKNTIKVKGSSAKANIKVLKKSGYKKFK